MKKLLFNSTNHPAPIFLLLFVSIAILFLAPGCRKHCKLVSEQLLTDQQKSQNPFNGFEKIIFNSGDSIIEFSGTGRHDTIKKYNISTSNCDWGVREFDELMFTNEKKRYLYS